MKMYFLLRSTIFLILLSNINVTVTEAQRWQWPEQPENLQVLPDTTSPAQLSAIMRSFTRALGVRCHYCHVGEEGQPFSEWDFASDEKSNKQKARIMMQMVAAINNEHLAKLEIPQDYRIPVTCITCHRGVQEPLLLQNILIDLVPAHGVDSTMARYHDLRTAYYGSFAYDFGERTLLDVADALVADGNPEAALRILDLNLEVHPSSWQTHFAAGEIYQQQDNTAAAIEQYEKALANSPDPSFIQQRIDQLRQE